MLDILLNLVDPTAFIIICRRLSRNDSKKVWKSIISFILLYVSMLLKQYCLKQNRTTIITIIAVLFPTILSFILLKVLYNNHLLIGKAILSLLLLSLSVDCVTLIVAVLPSNSLIQGFLLLACKSVELIILRWLLDVIQCHNNETIYLIIVATLWLLLNLVLNFIITEVLMKLFGMFINFGLFFLFLYLLQKVIKRMEKFDTLQGLRHDEQSHYALMVQMAKENRLNELEEYNKNISSALNECKYCTCDNFIIACAINEALNKASLYNINFRYKLETSHLPLSWFEQNSILRNVLNNAIEACKMVKENREIYFQITLNKYNEPKIKCINSSPKRSNCKTTKRNQVMHGFGLKNIKRIMKKRGEFYCEYIDKTESFLTEITFK